MTSPVLLRGMAALVIAATMAVFLYERPASADTKLGVDLIIIVYNVYSAYYYYQRSRGVTAQYFALIVEPNDPPLGRRVTDVIVAALAMLMLSVMAKN